MPIDWSKYGVETSDKSSKGESTPKMSVDFTKYLSTSPSFSPADQEQSSSKANQEVLATPATVSTSQGDSSQPFSPNENIFQKALDVVGMPSRWIAAHMAPNAPLIGQREDGTYGNLPGTNAQADYNARNPVPSTGNDTVDKIGDAFGSFVGPMVGTMGTGIGAVPGVIDNGLAQAGVDFSKYLGGKVAKGVVTGALAGAPINAAATLATTDPTLSDLAQSADQGALFGGALGAAGGAIGAGASKLANSLADKYAGTRIGDALGRLSGRSAQVAPEAEQTAQSELQVPTTNDAAVLSESKGKGSPSTDNAIPNERGLVRTLRNSGKLSTETEQSLNQSPDRTYQPITNQDTVNAANARVAQGLDSAESFALSGTKSLNPEQVATGFRLIDEFQKAGQTDKAVNMAESLSKRLTEAGQTVQAASIWNRLTPEGALVAAQRKVAQINQDASRLAKPVEVTSKNATDIMDAAAAIQRAGQSQERASQVMDIMDRLRAGHEVSQDEKQTVSDFIKDAEQFVKPSKARIPLEARPPKELMEPRVRDRVVSFLDTQEQAARERLKARGITLSSLPLDVYADYALIGAAKLGKGAVKFADWSEQMVKDLGEGIRPYLADIYEKAQETLSSSAKRFSEENFARVRSASSRLSEEELAAREEENKVIDDLTNKVKEAIEKSKNGTISDTELQEIRDLSEQVAEIPSRARTMTEEQRYRSQVKSLAKKIADVQSEKQPNSTSMRELQKLVRDVAKISDEGTQKLKDNKLESADAINTLAYGLKERTKPRVISPQEKLAESYIKKNGNRLSTEDIDLIRNMAKRVSDISGAAKQSANQDLQAVLNGFERAGIGRKISAVNYISMLLNPLTQIKNILGNELMYRLERLQRTLSTPADMIVSAATGKPRQITFKSGPTTWESFYRPYADFAKGLGVGAKAGWRGVNPEGLTTSYDISGQAFRSKLNPLTYLEKTLNATMKGFDYAAFNRATQQRLRETAYLDALNRGITGKENIMLHMDRYMANLDDNIAAVAKEYGKYVTLQDKTLLSSALSSFQRGLNKVSTFGLSSNYGVGTLVLPFARTPANLLMRAIDYSPAGFGRAIMQTAQIMLKKETDLTRADVIQSITRALLGTGLSGVGVWLAAKGVIRGESSSDKDVRELEKLSGLSQYQMNASALQRMIGAMVTGNMNDIESASKIQPGDMMYQYEWAQPTSMPLALGANIVQQQKKAKQDALKGNRTDSLAKQAYDVTTGAVNTLFNTSVLQGLQRAFDFQPNETNKVSAFVQNIVKQIPSMIVPTFVSKINQLGDNAIRETSSPDFTQNITNPALAKVPGIAQQFPQSVNTLGQPQTRENSFFDVFLNPAQRDEYKPSPEAKKVIDLLTETDDSRVAPRSVPKYITGIDPITKQSKRVDLTPDQLMQYQTIVGKETARLLGTLPDNLTTQQKVKRVLDILTKAGDKGRNEMRKQLNLR